jgi:predicted HAD superfamily phosphohydrolase YqeG
MYQERDTELTLKRLKALGFSSIIFDTNTATIERDSNGSLHKKVQAFVDFLNDPKSGVQVVVNDTDGGVVYVIIP